MAKQSEGGRDATGLKVVRRPGTPVYYLSGTYLNKRIRRSLGTTDRKEAEQIARSVIPELTARIKSGYFDSDAFGAIAEAYVARGKDDRFIADLVKRFGPRAVNDIADQELYDYAMTGKRAAWTNATRNRQIITPFQAIANFGAKQNPPRCRPRLFERFPVKKTAIRAAPEEWIKWMLVTAIKEGHPELTALMLLMTTTALRISEALRIDWQDINLRDGLGRVHQTKNSRPRQIKLAPVVIQALENIKPELPRGRVFRRYKDRNSVRKISDRICRTHGQPKYTSHEWGRHAFAERLLRMNKSLMMIKEAGGWHSLQVLVENYGHMERTHIEETVMQGAAGLLDFDGSPRALPE